jgi:hypothetical protein
MVFGHRQWMFAPLQSLFGRGVIPSEDFPDRGPAAPSFRLAQNPKPASIRSTDAAKDVVARFGRIDEWH